MTDENRYKLVYSNRHCTLFINTIRHLERKMYFDMEEKTVLPPHLLFLLLNFDGTSNRAYDKK